MSNGIAEEVAVAFKVVDGRIWSCDDAVAAAVAAGFFFLLLLLGAHCDVDDDMVGLLSLGGFDLELEGLATWKK